MTPRYWRSLSPGAALLVLVVGGTIAGAGVGMLFAATVGAIGDGREVAALAVPGAGVILLGVPAALAAAQGLRGSSMIPPAYGFAAVTLAWVLAAVAGSIPLLAAGTFGSPLDAFFEAMSGFTTTGATLIDDLESEPDAVLMWRSVMQWMGGIGIIVLVVAIAPVAGAGIQRVFYAEVSGVTADRLTPRIIDTAKVLAGIYLALSLAAGAAYLIAGMSLFDALNHMMTTIATGGFSTRDASIAAFDSLAIELIAIAGMALAGINFAVYWQLVRRGRLMPQLAEVRAFVTILAAAILAIALSVAIAGDADGWWAALRGAAFDVTSVMTTTGYVTDDFDAWNTFARLGLLTLVFVGACAGSTAGGMKVIRVILLAKSTRQEIGRQVRPQSVHVLRMGGRTFSENVRRAVLGFFLVYVFTYTIGSLAFAVTGVDAITAIGASAATINILGPGLGEVGATDNFTAMPAGGRAVGTVLMLIGRLEVFTVLALLAPLFGIRKGAR